MNKRSAILMQLYAALLLALLFLCPVSSYASFDTDCSPTWSIELQSYNYCSNLPLLSPANDNETNMRLLLADMQLAKIATPTPAPSWVEPYGAVPFDATDFKLAISNAVPSQRQKPLKPEPYDSSWIDLTEERCRTNDTGQQTFIHQVNNDPALKPAEKQLLIKQRQSLSPQCDHKLAFINVQPEWSTLVRQYVSYINGTIAFYNGDYQAAQKIYGALATVATPWIAETSSYMQTRTAVEYAYSTGMDEYGTASSARIDKTALATGFDAIAQYFKSYPRGQYVASARGLLRRLYWLGGQQRQLIDEFIWQFAHPQNSQFNLDMQRVPEEINQRIFENRLFNPANFQDPFFLTTYDLMFMRESHAEKYKPLSWAQLQAQQKYFKAQPELYRYLQAVHLFLVQHQAPQALAYLPKGNPPQRLNYLQLSQFVLKGKILEYTGQYDDARTLWTVLLDSAKSPYQHQMVELALALNLQHSKDFNAMFKPGSLIQDPAIRAVIIKQAANAPLLEAILTMSATSAQEKLAASFTLLHKSLNHQQYVLFVDSLKYLPKNAAVYKGYDSKTEALKAQPTFDVFLWQGHSINAQLKCSSLITLSKTLALQPQDEMALLCLGEFIRLTEFKNSEYFLEPSDHSITAPFNLALGENQVAFNQPVFARGEVYKRIISNTKNADLKAYALYRAINCYAPGGLNDCGGTAVEKPVRKSWFEQLKQNYPNTQWAKALNYYW